jgi:type I restriction enzyme S subunit
MNCADQDYCIGRGLAAVLAKPGYTDNIFLLHAIEENLSFLHRRSQGSTFLAIGTADLSMMPVAAPPLAQQQRIAEILATVDEAIEQTEALIAKTQQIKAGLMHDLFTRGVTKDGQLRPPREEAPYLYKESPLGWIPKEWEHGILNDIISPARPIVYGILMPGQGVPGGVPVIKVKDIIDGIVNDDDLLLTSQDIDEEYQRSKLKKGDILLTIRGTVGRLALVPPHLDQANITQDTARIGVVLGYPEFYRFYLETDQPRQYFAVNTLGVAVQGINLRDVRMTPVPIPQIIEQFSIAQRLKNAIETIRANEKSLGKLLNTKKGLMHDLLTGRVRVKTKSLPPTKSAHV